MLEQSDEQLDLEEVEAIQDQLEMEGDESYEFTHIVAHYIKDNILMFKVNYQSDTGNKTWDVSFNILKKRCTIGSSQIHQEPRI